MPTLKEYFYKDFSNAGKWNHSFSMYNNSKNIIELQVGGEIYSKSIFIAFIFLLIYVIYSAVSTY